MLFEPEEVFRPAGASHPEAAIITASVRQLVTLFGPDAGAPLATLFKDWAADALTSTDVDWTDGRHPAVDDRAWVSGQWRGRIILAGSETSETEPGYLAGAVHAAECALAEIKVALRPTARRRLS